MLYYPKQYFTASGYLNFPQHFARKLPLPTAQAKNRIIVHVPDWKIHKPQTIEQEFLRALPSSWLVAIYTPDWMERGTTKVKYLNQEHNTVTLGKSKARLTDPEYDA